ncbi:MAG: hypothetical protein OXE05_07305 [Chloroflexi bacterium]|nr:hypothetical protein [Chloroflexota bacterium]
MNTISVQGTEFSRVWHCGEREGFSIETNSDLLTVSTVILVGLGIVWRVETRISALSDRVSHIEGLVEGFVTKDDFSRLDSRMSCIEGLLEGYFQSGKKDDAQ